MLLLLLSRRVLGEDGREGRGPVLVLVIIAGIMVGFVGGIVGCRPPRGQGGVDERYAGEDRRKGRGELEAHDYLAIVQRKVSQ